MVVLRQCSLLSPSVLNVSLIDFVSVLNYYVNFNAVFAFVGTDCCTLCVLYLVFYCHNEVCVFYGQIIVLF